MKVHILYAQRKESYPGEYAPEAIAVIDEVGMSDNPDYMAEQKEAAIKTAEFESVVVVTLEVNGAKIMEALRPKLAVIPAEIV